MICQNVTVVLQTGCHPHSTFDEHCQKPVTGTYRQCGAGKGCKHTIAYCKDHGGDDRAMREMVEHHASAHGTTEGD